MRQAPAPRPSPLGEVKTPIPPSPSLPGLSRQSIGRFGVPWTTGTKLGGHGPGRFLFGIEHFTFVPALPASAPRRVIPAHAGTSVTHFFDRTEVPTVAGMTAGRQGSGRSRRWAKRPAPPRRRSIRPRPILSVIAGLVPAIQATPQNPRTVGAKPIETGRRRRQTLRRQAALPALAAVRAGKEAKSACRIPVRCWTRLMASR